MVKAAAGFIESQGDPYIRISYTASNSSSLVSSLMVLAGEVAARWCHERGIPIPYRVERLAQQNSNALHAFTRDVFYPQLVSGKRPSLEHYHVLRSLTGGVDVSLSPGPYFSMGVDMYTKATSPLRRYCDLLVHWQIEGALLEEHRRGQSLAPKRHKGSALGDKDGARASHSEKQSAGLAFLPFSNNDLEERVLPILRVREQYAKLLDKIEGPDEWMLQALVRAWRFGQASQKLPKTFRYTVSDVVPKMLVKGTIDWFDCFAIMDPEDLNGVARLPEIKIGDVFMVELADINVYARKVMVRAIEKA